MTSTWEFDVSVFSTASTFFDVSTSSSLLSEALITAAEDSVFTKFVLFFRNDSRVSERLAWLVWVKILLLFFSDSICQHMDYPGGWMISMLALLALTLFLLLTEFLMFLLKPGCLRTILRPSSVTWFLFFWRWWASL